MYLKIEKIVTEVAANFYEMPPGVYLFSNPEENIVPQIVYVINNTNVQYGPCFEELLDFISDDLPKDENEPISIQPVSNISEELFLKTVSILRNTQKFDTLELIHGKKEN